MPFMVDKSLFEGGCMVRHLMYPGLVQQGIKCKSESIEYSVFSFNSKFGLIDKVINELITLNLELYFLALHNHSSINICFVCFNDKIEFT